MSKFEKKEGAKIECASCGRTLICKMSEYPDQENKLQWQNEDGGAHYKFISKGNYQCMDSKGERIPPKPKSTPTQGDPPPKDDRIQILLNKFTVMEKDLTKIKEMVDANLAITSDAKLMLNKMVELP